jgi:hypothetical protein
MMWGNDLVYDGSFDSKGDFFDGKFTFKQDLSCVIEHGKIINIKSQDYIIPLNIKNQYMVKDL